MIEKYDANDDVHPTEGFRTDKPRDRVFVRCPGIPNKERTLLMTSALAWLIPLAAATRTQTLRPSNRATPL